MAWKKASIDLGDESIVGSLKIDESELSIPNIVELGETIKVNKKEFKVLSSSIDIRDNKDRMNQL